ncbi:MAG: Rha family transcriptional regulator [Desulfobulbaceae bacterium]|nr:Rha family transcriptional regulator [Desulfobulbaceae bacterium]
MDIVEIKKGEIVCDSSVVAKKFGVKHTDVTKAISRLFEDYPDLRGEKFPPNAIEKCWKEDRHYRGSDYTAYIMNREFFSLLANRFTNKKARQWQRSFNAAFYEMEAAILSESRNSSDSNWIRCREQSKQIRLSQTDVIKDFVEYATNQGSKNAKFYYKHITNATYAALQLVQHKKPKLRDTLDAMELAQLMVAENKAKQLIKKYMSEGEHYKTIFTLVKRDLVELGGVILI